MTIFLEDLVDKWSESGKQICAVCGKDFDHLPEAEYADEDGDTVPLLLWKDEGRLMLTLCWSCATKRMGDPTRN